MILYRNDGVPSPRKAGQSCLAVNGAAGQVCLVVVVVCVYVCQPSPQSRNRNLLLACEGYDTQDTSV